MLAVIIMKGEGTPSGAMKVSNPLLIVTGALTPSGAILQV
jgi:hypothetical protein